MSTDQSFIDFIVDQTSDAGSITYKKMFGEYGIYCDGKIVAIVCDNKLYLKPTDGGWRYIGKVVEDVPYPGASPRFLIEDKIDDRKWMRGLIRTTADELPEPKPKKKKNKSKK
jgi:TfoX/Sxy family transcriptional regulator of competence genes